MNENLAAFATFAEKIELLDIWRMFASKMLSIPSILKTISVKWLSFLPVTCKVFNFRIATFPANHNFFIHPTVKPGILSSLSFLPFFSLVFCCAQLSIPAVMAAHKIPADAVSWLLCGDRLATIGCSNWLEKLPYPFSFSFRLSLIGDKRKKWWKWSWEGRTCCGW